MSTALINETHDEQLKSWLAAANAVGAEFPIQNLPFGVFRLKTDSPQTPLTGCVAIGDQVLNLAAATNAGLFSGAAASAALAAAQPSLNALMAMGPSTWSALRKALSEMLREGSATQGLTRACLIPMDKVVMGLPAQIGDYTDFFASIHHAKNVGKLFRPDNPLLPNYKNLPIAYHGRASSIRVSGLDIKRPNGQTLAAGETDPSFGPSKRLDYELELGIWVGCGNALGLPIKIAEASEHIFGLCLLNDWSARDVQAWEYQPLGPFLAKNFATTISPWIVTMEALAPFRCALDARPQGDPQPLPYLADASDQLAGGLDIHLDVFLQSRLMREANLAPQQLSSGNSKHLYWTIAQMITHHTAGGCNLNSGDLFGSGTVSGPALGQEGCLLELTTGGKQSILLPNGEMRRFLEDGDTISFQARCQREGFRSIGFGECNGTIISAAY